MAYQRGSGADLREILLTLAEARLEESGHESLSLRALAASAGVTSGAPYRHFRDRASLLYALADRGFSHLIASHQRAAALDGTPQMKLEAAVNGYLEFAATRPRLFQLMFASDALRSAPISMVAAASFEVFQSIVELLPDQRSTPGRLRAVSLWSAMHGAAVLAIHGRLSGALAETISFQDVLEDMLFRYGWAPDC